VELKKMDRDNEDRQDHRFSFSGELKCNGCDCESSKVPRDREGCSKKLSLFKQTQNNDDALRCKPRDERGCGGSEPDVLHVIVPINNYVGYKRRYELFERFLHNISAVPGVIVYVVEVALGERPFIVTSKHNPRHLQLRTQSVLWHKENMINLMVQRLPRNWKYVAWVDGDIKFNNQNVGHETIHQLQNHDIVQMFQSVINLGPDNQVISHHDGFAYQYAQNGFQLKKDYHKYKVWHPGFAWAYTRKAWNDMGGLIDFAILGSADHHMALGLVGAINKSMPHHISESYKKKLRDWEARVERTIQRNISYVKGTIIHEWHGKFSDRRYQQRWEIIVDCKFDPDTDIKEDWQGLYMLDAPKPALRDRLRQYFLQRNEDTVELGQ